MLARVELAKRSGKKLARVDDRNVPWICRKPRPSTFEGRNTFEHVDAYIKAQAISEPHGAFDSAG